MKKALLFILLLCCTSNAQMIISAKAEAFDGFQSGVRQRLSFKGDVGYAEGLWKAETDTSNPKLEDFIEGTIHYKGASEKYDGTFKNGKPYNGQFSIDYGEYNLWGNGYVAKGEVVNGKFFGTLKGTLGDWGLLSRAVLGVPGGIEFYDLRLNGDENTGVFRSKGYKESRDRGYELTGTWSNGKWVGKELIVKYTDWDYYEHSLDLVWDIETRSGTGTAKPRHQVTNRILETPFTFKSENGVFNYYTKTGELLYSSTRTFLDMDALDALLKKSASWTSNSNEKQLKNQASDMANKIASNRASYKSKAVTFDTILRSWNNTVRENPYYHKSFPIRVKIERISTFGIVGMNNKYCLNGSIGDNKYSIGTDDDAFTELDYPITLYLYAEYYDKIPKAHFFRNAIFISK